MLGVASTIWHTRATVLFCERAPMLDCDAATESPLWPSHRSVGTTTVQSTPRRIKRDNTCLPQTIPTPHVVTSRGHPRVREYCFGGEPGERNSTEVQCNHHLGQATAPNTSVVSCRVLSEHTIRSVDSRKTLQEPSTELAEYNEMRGRAEPDGGERRCCENARCRI